MDTSTQPSPGRFSSAESLLNTTLAGFEDRIRNSNAEGGQHSTCFSNKPTFRRGLSVLPSVEMLAGCANSLNPKFEIRSTNQLQSSNSETPPNLRVRWFRISSFSRSDLFRYSDFGFGCGFAARGIPG